MGKGGGYLNNLLRYVTFPVFNIDKTLVTYGMSLFYLISIVTA